MFRFKTATKKTAATICASGIAIYHALWFKNGLEKRFPLKNVVAVDGMPEAELRRKIEYLSELSDRNNIEIVVASGRWCQYDRYQDQIVVGSMLKENLGCIEFSVQHELGHRHYWRYHMVPQITMNGTMAYLVFRSYKSPDIRIYRSLIALATVFHFLRRFDEFKADEYACERTSLRGLQDFQSLLLRIIDDHDNRSLWYRWTDVHPHPARRAAMIDQHIKNFRNNTVDAINPR